jgi:hypothetical protein
MPAIVRTATGLGELELAEQLVQAPDQSFPVPCAALDASRSEILEARGEFREAAASFAAVAHEWERLGSKLERCYALLGQGRCLAALGDPGAAAILQQARRLSMEIEAHGRVAVCDALLAEVTRLSS